MAVVGQGHGLFGRVVVAQEDRDKVLRQARGRIEIDGRLLRSAAVLELNGPVIGI